MNVSGPKVKEPDTARDVLVVLFICFVLLSLVAPNVSWIKSPLTPHIHGKVIDADTGKPIQDMLIIVSHEVRYTQIPGTGTTSYRQSKLLKTDKNGEFTLKRTIKPISFSIPLILDLFYDESSIITVNNNYEYMLETVTSNVNLVFNMISIRNKDKLLRNYEVYESFEKHNYPKDIKKTISEYRESAAAKLWFK